MRYDCTCTKRIHHTDPNRLTANRWCAQQAPAKHPRVLRVAKPESSYSLGIDADEEDPPWNPAEDAEDDEDNDSDVDADVGVDDSADELFTELSDDGASEEPVCRKRGASTNSAPDFPVDIEGGRTKMTPEQLCLKVLSKIDDLEAQMIQKKAENAIQARRDAASAAQAVDDGTFMLSPSRKSLGRFRRKAFQVCI